MKTATIAKKALIFGSSLLVASTMFLTTSCDNKDDEGGDVTPVTPVDQNVLKGDITKDMTLDASKVYSLVGAVHVKEGATLTIPAGTMIKADLTGTVAYLLIEKGAKIMAEGTVDKPIVFTSSAAIPRRRDWGGIIINGKAPINVTGGEAATEISPEIKYGGTVADDNSGMLKYVRVEYAGNSINEEKEHNTVTFNGVGNKTVVEYVQAYMGGDDGFEFFGGTVNTKYLISTGSGDDSFDWTFGWVGQNEYWYGEQANEMGDCSIEADGNETNNALTPHSNPSIKYATFIGRKDKSSGIILRRGTKVQMDNIIMNNCVVGFDIRDTETVKHLNEGNLTASNIKVMNATTNFKYTDNAKAAVTPNEGKALVNGTTATGAGNWTSAAWVKQLPTDLKVTPPAEVTEVVIAK